MARSPITGTQPTDDFNAYGDVNLSTTGNWAELNSAALFNVLSGAVRNIYSAEAIARWTGSGTWDSNQYAKVKLTTLSNSGSSKQGVVVRAGSGTNSSRTYYAAYVVGNATASARSTVVSRFSGGAELTLSSVTGDGWANGDTISLEVIGDSLKVYRNDIQLTSSGRDSIVNSDISGSSQLRGGMILLDGTGTARMDDFEAGNVTAGARKISLHLTDRNGADRTNLTGLKVFVWDFSVVANIETTLPADVTATGTTDSAGIFNFTLTDVTAAVGDPVLVLITDCDGSPTQSPATKSSFRAVTVAAA